MNTKTKNIPVVEKVLNANDQLAAENRARFDETGVFAVNLMASPGAGKTSLIELTIKSLSDRYQIAAIDGDLASSIDADRIAAAGAAAVQINTGGQCHLDAIMLRNALQQLDLAEYELIIVENVGNLVCPSGFQLGTHKSVLIASIPEGDDKPYKYPRMYQGVDILVINKTDLTPYVEFDMDYFQKGVEILNPGLVTFSVSCKTGDGVQAWLDWLVDNIESGN
ncbi:MAG: hydrogenase nickel incorporation protein HypB [Chloroflexota bacterium]|nr:hydrogenase nickel incorporation protein HypB [Chloroflexota bacterium]